MTFPHSVSKLRAPSPGEVGHGPATNAPVRKDKSPGPRTLCLALMEFTAHELWTQVLERAEGAVTEQSYRTWLHGTDAVGVSEGELIVEGPSQFHIEWVEDKFGALLRELTTAVVGRPIHLTFRAAESAPSLSFPDLELEAQGRQTSLDTTTGGLNDRKAANLNERYTFDRYVVGANNELAAAACRAVAEQPARMYNPLFLYGGVGLGKTHLMHAIGNSVLDANPSARVSYISSEEFTNDLVSSIQDGGMADFRRRFRHGDVLLVDDVHFLEGKERTQEEFFHTFNALHDAQRQIVITSDRPPKDMPGLEERLISRFEWGLVADIKPPDYETRMAILRKKAEFDRLNLDDDVIDFIARSCTASVRELEGAVIKLLAFSSLTHRDVDVSLARTALQGMIRKAEDRQRFSPQRIQRAVADEWGISVDGLTSKRRTRDLTVPRQVAMYLIRELLDEPLIRVGKLFGGRDHTTVIHSIRKVERNLEEDPAFRDRVEALRAGLSEAR